METRICRKCGRELPAENFFKNHTCKDGIDTICKDCKNEYQREWQKKNKEKKKAQKIENERIEFEKKYKIYTNRELAKFTPRELMLELKARGYVGELLYVEVIRKEHRINLATFE